MTSTVTSAYGKIRVELPCCRQPLHALIHASPPPVALLSANPLLDSCYPTSLRGAIMAQRGESETVLGFGQERQARLRQSLVSQLDGSSWHLKEARRRLTQRCCGLLAVQGATPPQRVCELVEAEGL